MGWKPLFGLTLATLVVCAAHSALAQAVPAAKIARASSAVAVGAGFSGYNADFGAGHLLGGTLWIDYTPPLAPRLLHGIGLEVEARDLNYGRSPKAYTNQRMDVASGGVIYTLPRFAKLRPYGKFIMGFGSIDNGAPVRSYHETRTVTSVGGGVDYRVLRKLWARVDYEYQSWPDYFKLNGAAHGGALTPEGFTVGVLYRFGLPPSH